jgi:choloylglycine hydrolase
MKLKIFALLAVSAMLVGLTGFRQQAAPQTTVTAVQQKPKATPTRVSPELLHSRRNLPTRGCTVLTVSQGGQVFFAGNDDYINRDSTYWVDQGSDTRYGAIYFGRPDNVQQGFNEKGLAYDANGVPKAPVTSHPGRQPVYGGYASYLLQILQECATVEEVIAWVQEHQWHKAMHDQMHFADATGDAVVISAGPDGKVAFTRKPAGDGFLVSTNFNLANPSSGGYPCWRYTRAEKMLHEIQGEGGLTAERVAAIADAVHVEGPSGWTLYSVVADLRQRLVYVYFMFQYDAPIVLSIDEEIARSQPSRPLSELFPEETQQRADQAYRRLMTRSTRCDAAGLVWLGLVVLSLALFLLLARSRRRGLAVWVPVVTVLGPAGLLAWLISARSRRTRALVEVVGDLPPYVFGMVAALLMAILVPSAGQDNRFLLLAFYGLPFTLALFLYQAPLLARAAGSGYVRTAWRRLPAVLVSTHLALAGLLAISLPLVNRHLGYCGFSTLTILSWWAIVVVGALGGGLLLSAYHAWGVRRGFAAWSALLWDAGEVDDDTTAVSSPSWRRLWLWILLSFGILVAGIVLGMIGTAN